MAEDDPLIAGVSSRIWSEEQRAAVSAEIALILAHPIFKTSNRCTALLRYVVDHALSCQEEEIKERTLGVEVFGRSSSYDLSTDPIVRRVASEIRKRLAQYYLEDNSQHCVKIFLERGSYLPVFKFPLDGAIQESADAEDAEDPMESLLLTEFAAESSGKATFGISKIHRRIWIPVIVAAVLVPAAILLSIHFNVFHTPEYRLWKPLFDSSDSITVCLPDNTPLTSENGKSGMRAANNMDASSQLPSAVASHDPVSKVTFRDARVSNNITALLIGYKRQTDLRSSLSLKFRDFQQKPTVLIGGLNNLWVPVFLSKLRYSVQFDSGTQDRWIQDSQNPSKREWQIEGGMQSNPPADFAIVTRIFYTGSGEWLIALSGLEDWGTQAAAALVSDPKLAKLIPNAVLDHGNFQIVLKTTIIGGEAGPIQILAVQTW